MRDHFADSMDSMLDKAIAYMERAHKDIEAAAHSGREVVQVVCKESTKRGDVFEIAPMDENGEAMDPEGEDSEALTVKVIAVHSMTGIDPDTLQIRRVCEALCVVLEPGDITTEEEFAALYADFDSKASEDAPEGDSEALVLAAPNVCSCGANRQMCERNQNVFGGHLQ